MAIKMSKEIEEEEDPTIEDPNLFEEPENLYDGSDDTVDEDESIE